MNCRGMDHCSSVAEVIRFRRCVSYDAIQHLDIGFQLHALATKVYLGDPTRFADGKALSSYVGMIPEEDTSGKRRRLGI
jgi:hypothetical protein